MHKVRPFVGSRSECSLLAQSAGDGDLVRFFRHAQEVSSWSIEQADTNRRLWNHEFFRDPMMRQERDEVTWVLALFADTEDLLSTLRGEPVRLDLEPCRTRAELCRIHADAFDELNRGPEAKTALEDLRLKFGTTDFKVGPFLNTKTIVQIADAEALIAEGKKMHHCVGGLARRALKGTHVFYRVLEPERATLALRRQNGKWVVDDFKLASNATPSSASKKAVRAWLVTDHTRVRRTQGVTALPASTSAGAAFS